MNNLNLSFEGATLIKTTLILLLFIISFSLNSARAERTQFSNKIHWAQWSELEPELKFVLGQDICFPIVSQKFKEKICHKESAPLFIQSLSGGMGVPLMILTANSEFCSHPDLTSEEILVLPIAASPGRDRRVIVQYGPQCLWTIWVEVYDFYDFSFLRWPSY